MSDKVTHLQRLLTRFAQDPELELEMCLCAKAKKDAPPTQLQFDDANCILGKLQESAKAGIFTTHSRQIVDYFYEKGAVRHRCFFGCNNQVSQTIRKSRVDRVLATCPERQFSFCFNLKRETPILDFQTIEAGTPNYIRIQKEWVFEYKNAFQYIVKQVNSGGTSKQECLAKPLQFEVEIELLHNSDYIQQRTVPQIEESFIAKCLDLCERTNEHDEDEPLTMLFERD